MAELITRYAQPHNFLFSMLSQSYNIIIDHGIIAPGHGRDVVDGMNATNNFFLVQLMETMKVSGSKGNETKMAMHSSTHRANISLA